LVRRYQALPAELVYWRPFFLAGFVGILVSNVANSYLFDRYLFICIAFAATLQRAEAFRARSARSGSAAKEEPRPLGLDPRVA